MSENIFKTDRLQTAIFLSASKALDFIGCKRITEGKVEFWYRDPQRLGEQIEADFESGASIPAIAIFVSQRHLRKLMTQAQQQRIVVSENSNVYSNSSTQLTSAAQ